MYRQQKTEICGLVAMAATILIWACFAINLRSASGSTLVIGDVAMLRFGVPAVLLLPWWKATWKKVRSESLNSTLAIVLGAGLPFTLLVTWGAQETSAALVGTVTPGAVPLFVALFSVAVLRKPIGWVRSLGVALISAGILVALLGSTSSLVWGVIPLLGGSLLWACYTIALSQVRYRPLEIAVLLSVPSTLVAAITLLAGWLPSEIFSGRAEIMDVLVFAIMQGVVVGIVSTVLYSYATKNIGSLKSSGFGALSPVLATLISIPLLGEIPTNSTLLCLLMVTSGVLVTNVISKIVLFEKIPSGSSQTAKQQADLRFSTKPWLPANHRGSWMKREPRHLESVL